MTGKERGRHKILKDSLGPSKIEKERIRQNHLSAFRLKKTKSSYQDEASLDGERESLAMTRLIHLSVVSSRQDKNNSAKPSSNPQRSQEEPDFK
jgi:hypothetical protein